ncbi:MAG: hypothetical protein H6709_16160 [Kofleriaceae bacterium]|nr:hypothetical protein [Kofleriaceae bacterium]MCB9573614.1 hypothetical protein [Kofleriaceae bacterium]
MTPPADVGRRQLVLRFLSSIGRPDEAERYLALFRAERPESFAILHVSDALVRAAEDALLVDLRMLAEVGLRPVITMGAARTRAAAAWAARLRDALAPVVPCAVVGPDDVAATVRDGRLALCPLLEPAGDDRGNVDARFDALAALAAALDARKLVFLGRRSGLQPRDGRVASIIDLTTEQAAYLGPDGLTGQQALLLRQIARILDRVSHRLTVSVTSPFDLLRELFTVKGAGTLVRRGSTVARFDGGAGVDAARLGALIEAAFGRPLVDDFTARPARAIYVADDYRGAAVITDAPLAPYLSKFAVTLEARGDGVGRDLWRAMAADLPRLFWRSRAANPITAWYRDQCDGLQRLRIGDAEWVVMWRGLAPAEVPDAIAWCAAAPADFR